MDEPKRNHRHPMRRVVPLEKDMKANKAETLPRNIIWQEPTRPACCEHRYELIAQDEGKAIRRCTKCGNMEVK